LNQPTLIVIAGANGAGKSTLTSGNSEIFGAMSLLDPDAAARTINSEITGASAIAAGRMVLQIAAIKLQEGQSFAVETTLSGKNYLRMMLKARDRGFEVVLVYIGTNNVEINLLRIANRVLAGGHDVPEADVRRRYRRSLQNLPVAIQRADHVMLFDNSNEDGYQIVGVIDQGHAQWFNPIPQWADALQHSQ
jgi:predicted ABC-type ATPase